MDAESAGTATPWTRRIDDFLRFLDLVVQRIDAGTALERRFRIERHTLMSYAWPALVCTAVLTGMPVISGLRVTAASITLATCGVALLLFARHTLKRSVEWDALSQCALVLACCAVVTFAGSTQVPEEGGLYLHALVPIAAIFALSIAITAWVTPACFREHVKSTTYPAGIATTQLFQRRPPASRPGVGEVAQAFSLALARVPELLYLPCLVAVVVPAELVPWALALLIVPMVMLIVAELDERAQQILGQLSSQFYRNGALVLTVMVIGFGVARFLGLSYVTTVLDSTAGAQIAIFIVYAYALVWWQDYWIARLAGQQMLRIAGGAAVGPSDVRIDYPYSGNNEGIRVAADGRSIQLHGLGRLLVLRPDTFDRAENREQPPFFIGKTYPAFHTWTFQAFFEHVAACAHGDGSASPSPDKIAHRLQQHAVMVRLLTLLALGACAWALSLAVQQAAVEANGTTAGSVRLAQLIGVRPADRPVVLVAASGGGTRAALFTAAVLEGLAHDGVIDDVVLGSGVSGGGASLAYFAAHRTDLDWDAYFKAMKTPYIRDVLDRSSEWRILAGRRLGTLLEESFDRHWQLPAGRRALGEVGDMGLIFNTTIAGHFHAPAAGDLAAVASAWSNQDAHESALAGGRLIITNLQTEGMFADVNRPYGTPLPVVVDDASFKLSAAAALNANFPPVFSNAPIDVAERTRYWVTDGGAADNRGAEMLLYALRKALLDEPALEQRRIVVLIVDAGAAPGEYSQDRGIGSAIGAGGQFAMHLVAELARDLPGDVRLHPVPMPRLLRENFGTHWMLQSTIDVGDDDVTGDDMVSILRALYGRGSCGQIRDEAARRACAAALATEELCASWCKARAALTVGDLETNCCSKQPGLHPTAPAAP